MFTDDRGKPDGAVLRKALYGYAFNTSKRAKAPDDSAVALAWVRRNTAMVSALANAAEAPNP